MTENVIHLLPPDGPSLFVYVDGSHKKENHSHYAGFGIVIYEGDREVWQECGGERFKKQAYQQNGSNYAERLAIRESLDCLLYLGYKKRDITIFHDASFNPKKGLGIKSHGLMGKFRSLTFVQINRKRNKLADKLARQGRLEAVQSWKIRIAREEADALERRRDSLAQFQPNSYPHANVREFVELERLDTAAERQPGNGFIPKAGSRD